MRLPLPSVELHQIKHAGQPQALGIFVVREDLLAGGTKLRYCLPLFERYDHVVYASSAQGGAQLALAYAARALGKQATIVVAKRKQRHPRTAEAAQVGAEIVEVSPGYLSVTQKRAKDIASATGAHLLEFGAESEEALALIHLAGVSVAQQLGGITDVWSACGSGVLSRGLQRAFPDAEFHGLAVGHALDDSQRGRAEVIGARLRFEQEEKRPTPFPSCPNYDAKAWHACVEWIRKYYDQHPTPPTKRVLFWNVMGPSPTSSAAYVAGSNHEVGSSALVGRSTFVAGDRAVQDFSKASHEPFTISSTNDEP